MKAIKIIEELIWLGETESCGTFTYEEEGNCLERMFGPNLVVQYKGHLKDGVKYLYCYEAELRATPDAIIIDEYEVEIGLYEIEQ